MNGWLILAAAPILFGLGCLIGNWWADRLFGKPEASAGHAFPTLTITTWGATPDQAETIFEAAVDAALDAEPDGVDVDATAVLGRRHGAVTQDWT